MRELKKYALRPSRKPEENPHLAGTVLVLDDAGKGYATIRFDLSFVEAVGRVLPYGLGPGRQACLKVMRVHGTDRWKVFATYLDESRGTLLWESDGAPKWLGKIRRK